MKCESCGCVNDDIVRYCMRCGRVLPVHDIVIRTSRLKALRLAAFCLAFSIGAGIVYHSEGGRNLWLKASGLFFLACFAILLYHGLRRSPVLTFAGKGLLVRGVGLIPWDQISGASVIRVPLVVECFIRVNLVNASAFRAGLSFWRRNQVNTKTGFTLVHGTMLTHKAEDIAALILDWRDRHLPQRLGEHSSGGTPPEAARGDPAMNV